MDRPKKNCHPFRIRMDNSTYDRLTDFCEESGQSKTLAVEHAINMYIDNYDAKKKATLVSTPRR